MEPSKVESYSQFIRKLYPVVLFGCGIFLGVLFFAMVGLYKVKGTNPVILISYTSPIHLFAIFVLYCGLSYFPKLYTSFLLLNAFWIVAVTFVIALIFSWFDKDIRKEFSSNLLLHVLLECYGLTAMALEIAVYLLQNETVKVVKQQKGTKGKLESKKQVKIPINSHGKDTIALAVTKEYALNDDSESEQSDEPLDSSKVATNAKPKTSVEMPPVEYPTDESQSYPHTKGSKEAYNAVAVNALNL